MTANVALTDSFDQWRVKTNEVVVMTQTDGMSNFIKVLDTTDSTSNTTGSIIAAGGLGVLKSAVIGENLRVHGNIHANGAISADGSITLGDADTDNIVFSADINSSIVPNVNNNFNIGSTTMYWANTWTGHLTTEQKTDSGKPALTVNSLDADVDGVRITASQDTANAFHINAHSLTTGTGITVLADALTTGSALTIDSDAGVGTRNVVEIINDNALAVGATPFYVKNDSTNTVAKFIGTSTIVLPVGTSSNRGPDVTGGIRYNTTTSSFEGYGSSQWGSLGGVIDVDQDTKIIAETSAGTDNDTLDFYTQGVQRMKIDNTAGAGAITVGVDGAGYDVKFFGDTATTGYMLWDQSTDDLILGSSSRIGIGTTAPLVDLDVSVSGGTAGETDGIAQFNWSTSAAAGGRLRLGHSNHATIGNYAAVDAADVLGQITFEGSDGGSDAFWTGAAIKATAAETWTAPSGSTEEAGSYLTFHTTDIGTPNLDERMRITDAGNVGINTNAPASKLDVQGTVQVGTAGTGHDVIFYGDTSGKHLLWDQSEMELGLLNATKLSFWDIGGGEEIVASGDGHLEINAGTTLDITAPTVDINADTLVQVSSDINVGVDGTGHDVHFYGDTASKYFHWDQSEDAVRFGDSTEIRLGNLLAGDMKLYHDGSHSYITNVTGNLSLATTSGGMYLGTSTSGIAINIGHGTSVVTIGDNLTVTDTLTELSMREMKTNIEPIENILPSVLQMQGVKFDWKKDEDKGLNHYGFIADEVEKVLPNLVSRDNKGKPMGIQYSKMTAVLLEAIKEQQVQIDELKSKIN